jgi:hypothetical protein
VVIVSGHCGEEASGKTEEYSQELLPFHPPHPKSPRTLLSGSPYSLVLDLEVEVPTEPVIEGRMVDVACCLDLEERPAQPF